jgi:hypothetical protein
VRGRDLVEPLRQRPARPASALRDIGYEPEADESPGVAASG